MQYDYRYDKCFIILYYHFVYNFYTLFKVIEPFYSQQSLKKNVNLPNSHQHSTFPLRKYKKLRLFQESVLPSLLIQIIMYFSEDKNRKNRTISNPQNQSFIFHKIHFSIRKKLAFGQGLYVCGNTASLGMWDPKNAFRLKWNQGDLWSGCIVLNNDSCKIVEYKYVVADWAFPNIQKSQWETGEHNRKLSLSRPKTFVICDDRWNMDKITLNLSVKKDKKCSDENYYVIGDIPELGRWQQKKQMKKYQRKQSSKKQNIEDTNKSSNEWQNYFYSFYTFRGKDKFCYYYLKKGTVLESERKPGRFFSFTDQNSAHPHRKAVTYDRGQINIHDQCSISELIFSKVTEKLFVGSYPKTTLDLQKLKKEGVTAILSIQSERDFKKHGVTPHYMNLLCQDNQLTYRRCSIIDMNNYDFICKAENGLCLLRDLIKQGETVYVHCSAGIYRSPQMIALYLTLCEKYSIQQALQAIKSHHPHANPSCKVIKDTIKRIELQNFHSKISI